MGKVMKVRELVSLLEKQPSEAEVMIYCCDIIDFGSKREEGVMSVTYQGRDEVVHINPMIDVKEEK